MELYFAIDLLGGRAVRLCQGDYDRATVYSEDPAAVAAGFAAAGAKNLHLVDLDGARAGRPVNDGLIARIAGQSGLFVEVGGGIRDAAAAQRYFDAGASRVILGTAALEQPDFLDAMLRRYGARIAVGVDARGGRVATRGWLATSAVDSFEFCRSLRDRGVRTVIYTDIAKDGGGAGTNLDAYRRLTALTGLAVIASGGITAAAEITALAKLGAAGAILGRALYTGALTPAAALAAAGGSAEEEKA